MGKGSQYKTIGIIGGMGPAATVDLMNKIIEMTDAGSDQDHIRLLVDSNTRIPDRTAAILHGGASPVPEMLDSARKLESIGADFLIMPCNTAHFFLPYLEQEVGIPFLNMPVETARLINRKGASKAAVLATDGTDRSGLYEKALSDAGIETLYPDEEQQKQLMSVIYDYIKKGITEPDALPAEELRNLTDDLRARGAQVLILACTELPLAFSLLKLDADDVIDATSVLAGAAVRAAGAELKSGSKY